jgi:hypothetical protein
MSEYTNLLQESRSKVREFQKPIMATAKEYIPKMFKAIRNENPKITTRQARQRIEKDCKDLWSTRTILDALPDEAKNLEKQKAGKQRNKIKTLNSAAMTAAPKVEEKIVMDTFGNIASENEPLQSETVSYFNSIDRKSQENLEENSDKNVEKLLDFEFCLKFIDLRQYMTFLSNTNGENGDVWFNGKINKNSGQVVEANIGRNNQVDK